MTTRSAAVYGVGGVLLVACLAAANMPQADDPLPPRAPRAERRAAPDALAADVASQAARLRERMAQAPAPGVNLRNPFSFAARAAAPAPAPTVHAAVADDPAPVFTAPLPSLTLMGIAEDTTPAGPKRTAIIGGQGDELYMVVVGDAVGARYRVTRIGADAVELEDVQTKGFRRLALR